jgi:gliding motility-associated-like protein
MNMKIGILTFLFAVCASIQGYAQCNNCTTSYASNAAIVATANNQVICISGGSSFTFISTYRNVRLKICAPNVQLTNVQVGTTALSNTIESFGDNTHITSLVAEADTFSFIAHNTGALLSSATINGKSSFLTTTGAILTISQNLNPGGQIFFTAEENSTINTQEITSNQGGRIIVGKNAHFNSTGKVILQNEGFVLNNGELTASGDFTVQNGGNALTNFCGESKITIGGKLIINSGRIYNAGTVIAGTIAINANAGPIYMNEGAVMQATNLETNNTPNLFRGDSIPAGECALFKITSYGSFNSALSNSSKIKYCGPSATATQLGQATPDCNCISDKALCTPLCLPPTAVTITAPVNNVCAGSSTVLTANASGLKAGDTYTYSWYKNSVVPANLIVTNTNTNTLTVSESATYFVVVANTIKPAACSTQNTSGFTFTVNPIPPQPTVTPSGPLTFCNGGSVTLTASTAGYTGGTYTWSTGATGSSLIVSTSGTYSVIYKSAADCTAPTSASTTVTVNPIPPQPTVTPSGPLTFCNGGSVTLTASTAGYTGGTYTWSNGATGSSLIVSTSGTYSVIYKSAADCTAPTSASTTVTVNPIPPQPTVTASGPLIFCNGGSVTLTASTAGYTGGIYTWSNGATGSSLVVSTSGTYSVIYKSAADCTAPTSASTTVTVNPIPPQPTVTASGPLIFCNGGSVTLTASTAGYTGGTYTWSNGATGSSLVVSTSGTYSVIYKSAADCTAPTSASTTVTVNPIPPQPTVTASGPLIFCNGGSVTLTASTAGYTGGTYTWSTGATGSSLVVTASGTYSVIYKSAADCTAPTSASTTVTVNPIPPQPTVTTSGPLIFCNGSSVTLTASTSGYTGGTYTWSNGASGSSLVVSTSGTYSVIYKSGADCIAPTSASTTVTVNPVPPQPTVTASGPTTFCYGGSVTLTASTAGYTGGTYTWSNGATGSSLVVTASGTYSVIYKSGTDCTAPTSASTTVTVNPIPPQPTVTASGPLIFCNGGSVTLTASTAGYTGGTYTWSTGATGSSLVVSTSGTYSVIYKSAADCTAPTSASTTVTVNPIPPQPTVAASGPTTFCNGGSVTLTASTAGYTGGTYTWSTGATGSSLVVSSSGTYSVIYKSAADCTAPTSASTTVTVNPIPPQPTVTASGPLIFCNGGSVTLTASTAGYTGGTYTWSNGATGSSLVVTTSGTYTVDYKSGADCTAPTSASTTVTVNPIPPQPTVTASGPTTFCNGGSVTLTASTAGYTGGTYTWSNGATGSSLVVSTSGTYSVIYKSGADCTAPTSASTMVTVNPIPPQPTVTPSGPTTFCNGGSVTLTASTAGYTGGTYTWSNGATGSSLVVTTSGTYTVDYKSGADCPAPTSASTTVTVNPIPPQPTVTASGPSIFCNGGSVTLTASTAGYTGGTYTWSNGATGNSLIVTTSGIYKVDYKSDVDCPAPTSASTTVTVNPIPPQPTVTTSGPSTFCNGGSVTLTASTAGYTGGTYTWSNGATGNSLVVTTSGTYTVDYKSGADCPAPTSASTTVTVNPIPPQPTVTASGPSIFCNGGSVTLTASTAGYTGGTYTWSNGATGNSLVVTTSGIYKVDYKSDVDCPAPTSASTTVTVNPIPPKPEIATTTPATFCSGDSIILRASSLGFSGGTFNWSNGSAVNPLKVTASGKYSVTYTSSNDCPSAASDSIEVTVNPIPPKPEIATTTPTTFCSGDSIILRASSLGFSGGTFNWSNGSAVNPLKVTASGKYSVTYTSSNDCPSAASDSIEVTVNPIPPKPEVATSTPTTFCSGDSIILRASSLGFSGGTFNWSTGSAVNPLKVTASGKYSVTYTSSKDCPSAASDSIEVTVNPIPPAPRIDTDGPTVFCMGGSVVLSASSAGFTGGKFNWSNGSADNPLKVTASGKYAVRYTSSNDCPSAASDTIEVTVNPIPPQPAVQADGPLTFCPGETVTMSAVTTNFTGTFEWFKEDVSLGTDAAITLSEAGNYRVYFKTDAGCAANLSKEFSIRYSPDNSPVDLGKDIVTCQNYIDLHAVTPAVGKGKWSVYEAIATTFASKTDSNNVRVLGLQAGSTYSFIYTVSEGCGREKSDTISIRSGLPDFDITSLQIPMDTLCVGVSRRVEAFATGGSDHYSYAWINAATMDTITTDRNYLDIVPDGMDNIYYVYVNDLDQAGCRTFQDTLTIHAIDKQTLLIPNLITPNEDGKNDELKIVEVNNYDKKMFSANSYIEIYNRWGNRVYEANNYDGTWKADNTEDGVYYYYLKPGCGHEEYKGWLQILAKSN